MEVVLQLYGNEIILGVIIQGVPKTYRQTLRGVRVHQNKLFYLVNIICAKMLRFGDELNILLSILFRLQLKIFCTKLTVFFWG